MSSSNPVTYTTRADVLWGMWDVPNSESKSYVIGGTMDEARIWANARASISGMSKHIPVATVPVGIHGGTLWVVGSACYLPQYSVIVNIARASGMQVLEG